MESKTAWHVFEYKFNDGGVQDLWETYVNLNSFEEKLACPSSYHIETRTIA